MKAPVTRQAVIQRINRKLKKEDKLLRKNRRAKTGELGEYYVVDRNTIHPQNRQIDVEELARKIGALTEYERMEN